MSKDEGLVRSSTWPPLLGPPRETRGTKLPTVDVDNCRQTTTPAVKTVTAVSGPCAPGRIPSAEVATALKPAGFVQGRSSGGDACRLSGFQVRKTGAPQRRSG